MAGKETSASWRRAARRLGALLTCGAVFGSPAGALPAEGDATSRSGSLAQLGLETWTPDSGLAGSWVREIVQGSDGFLWISTSGGLSRFDGRRFRNFSAAQEAELPANSIGALAPSSGGRLAQREFIAYAAAAFGQADADADEKLSRAEATAEIDATKEKAK